jgi:hypothetical protein
MLTSTPDKALDFVVLTTGAAANQSNKALDESLSAHWQRLIGKAGDRATGNPQNRLRTLK